MSSPGNDVVARQYDLVVYTVSGDEDYVVEDTFYITGGGRILLHR